MIKLPLILRALACSASLTIFIVSSLADASPLEINIKPSELKVEYWGIPLPEQRRVSIDSGEQAGNLMKIATKIVQRPTDLSGRPFGGIVEIQPEDPYSCEGGWYVWNVTERIATFIVIIKPEFLNPTESYQGIFQVNAFLFGTDSTLPYYKAIPFTIEVKPSIPLAIFLLYIGVLTSFYFEDVIVERVRTRATPMRRKKVRITKKDLLKALVVTVLIMIPYVTLINPSFGKEFSLDVFRAFIYGFLWESAIERFYKLRS